VSGKRLSAKQHLLLEKWYEERLRVGTAKDIAAKLKISPHAVYDWIANQKAKALKELTG